MASPYHVSIPSFQSCEGLIVGRSTRLRFHECKKNATKIWLPPPSGRLKHAGFTYCLHLALGASLCSPGAATNMKALAVLSESMQKFASSYTQCLMVADLDPQFAKVLIGITGPFLSAFSLLFILRIVMSWYPKLPVGKFPYVIAYAPTEPFLVITRKVIPPLGGVDVTPVVWFGFVSFLNEILIGPQGLLVLLSQQT